MKPFLIIALLGAALYVSCYYTEEICPILHKSSELTIHERVIMYKHVVECCGVKENIYGMNAEMIDAWINIHPNKMMYHTQWGTFRRDDLIGLYFAHFFVGMFVVVLWLVIEEENRRVRR